MSATTHRRQTTRHLALAAVLWLSILPAAAWPTESTPAPPQSPADLQRDVDQQQKLLHEAAEWLARQQGPSVTGSLAEEALRDRSNRWAQPSPNALLNPDLASARTAAVQQHDAETVGWLLRQSPGASAADRRSSPDDAGRPGARAAAPDAEWDLTLTAWAAVIVALVLIRTYWRRSRSSRRRRRRSSPGSAAATEQPSALRQWREVARQSERKRRSHRSGRRRHRSEDTFEHTVPTDGQPRPGGA